MAHICLPLPAVRSALALLAAASVVAAATRPRYGGTLRMEMHAPVESADPPRADDEGPAARRLASLEGPFRIVRWEPGRRAAWAAAEDAPGGRPFLDAVEIEMGRSYREQALDLELGKADLVEVGPNEVRRVRRAWSSAPVRLLALAFGTRIQDARVRKALALAIDRAAIHNVLLQRQGEASGALLPQWLSGYAFIFPAAQDLARARAIAAALPPSARAFSLASEPGDARARAIAERVALNARDAGLLVSISPLQATADVRLVEVRIESADPGQALTGVASALGLPEPAKAAELDAVHAAERTLLEGARVIPLLHLPEVWGVGPRVRAWPAPGIGALGEWKLEQVWLDGR